jgi:hypothetical protein
VCGDLGQTTILLVLGGMFLIGLAADLDGITVTDVNGFRSVSSHTFAAVTRR